MNFASFNFLIFFPFVAVLYWVIPQKFRRITLLVASYFFYLNVKPAYALLLAGVTFLTYWFARLIDSTDCKVKKKRYLMINIVLLLMPMLFFKYFNVLNQGIYHFLHVIHFRWPFPEIKYLAPVGISFYTFMAIGYTIDVYNHKIESEKNIGVLALFISFFPLLLSGPIERAPNMLQQFKETKSPDYGMIVQGFKLMLWGYFMKLVVAARVGIYVDAIFGNISQHNGTSLLFASFLYPFQMYADFGGYSLIAIGTASVLGFKVMPNFKRPFFATSISEFWRRWHVSFSSWLRDYLFLPLAFSMSNKLKKDKYIGMDVTKWIYFIAIMITFAIAGVWHGAGLNYLLWGLLFGIYLTCSVWTHRLNRAIRKELHISIHSIFYKIIKIISTYILVAIAWIFLRAPGLSAFEVLKKIFSFPGDLFIGMLSTFAPIIIVVAVMLMKDITDEFYPQRFLIFENKLKIIRILAYSGIIIVILLIGVFDGGQFIYFQF
jgi:alginate O-acetyltransferase complex protein AlgI